MPEHSSGDESGQDGGGSDSSSSLITKAGKSKPKALPKRRLSCGSTAASVASMEDDTSQAFQGY